MKEYTKAQVGSHCTHDDLWIIFDGKVYDLTPYYKNHPGGTAMLRQAGKDASAAIRAVGSHGLPWKFIEKKLDDLYIGKLKQ